MSAWVQNWLLNLVTISGTVGVVGYFFRDTLAVYFAKSIENRFEMQMETFRADIRDKESELDKIMSFLVAARQERDSAVQVKKLEAAEALLRVRKSLSKLMILVEYLKALNIEVLIKNGDDRKTNEFIELLIKPIDIEGNLKSFGAEDQTLPLLYLSDSTLKKFEIYQSIILGAVILMKLLAMPLSDKSRLMKSGVLAKQITDLLPHTKAGFEKYGDNFAYYWAQYFYDEVLISLRSEIAGTDDLVRDTKSIERLALDSRQTQMNIREAQQKIGLSESVIQKDDSAKAMTDAAVEKAPA